MGVGEAAAAMEAEPRQASEEEQAGSPPAALATSDPILTLIPEVCRWQHATSIWVCPLQELLPGKTSAGHFGARNTEWAGLMVCFSSMLYLVILKSDGLPQGTSQHPGGSWRQVFNTVTCRIRTRWRITHLGKFLKYPFCIE